MYAQLIFKFTKYSTAIRNVGLVPLYLKIMVSWSGHAISSSYFKFGSFTVRSLIPPEYVQRPLSYSTQTLRLIIHNHPN